MIRAGFDHQSIRQDERIHAQLVAATQDETGQRSPVLHSLALACSLKARRALQRSEWPREGPVGLPTSGLPTSGLDGQRG